MTIVFRNPGTLDPTSIKTFGVSSKEKPGAIGFFGTGLKYAIAILLRHGCSIAIHTGGQRYVFATERATVRVDEFTFVTMNGERLAFTTELGKTWDLTGAFRELYCNCVDESGEAYEVDNAATIGVRSDETVITVDGEPFLDVWAERNSIILGSDPLLKHASASIHPGPSQYLYYRGVRAMKLNEASRYTYNILRRLDLTEDRTIKYPWDANYAIRAAVMECDDERLILNTITAPRGTFEAGLEYGGVLPSDTFRAVVAREWRAFSRFLNMSAVDACRAWIMDDLHNTEKVELEPLDANRLKRAVAFCQSIGFPVEEYPIHVTEFLGEGVLGRAHEGRIFVSKRVFMMGTKMLAGTLVEEYLHLRHKVRDETREMQNFLMDTIVSLGERLTGEPL